MSLIIILLVVLLVLGGGNYYYGNSNPAYRTGPMYGSSWPIIIVFIILAYFLLNGRL